MIEKHEIREKSITNIYLSFFFILFIASMIITRPYIKNIVNEVRFASIAAQYTDVDVKSGIDKLKIQPKSEEKKLASKPKEENKSTLQAENTISLNAETTINLFEDLGYTLKGIRQGQQVKPIYLTKLPKDLKTLGNTKTKKRIIY